MLERTIVNCMGNLRSGPRQWVVGTSLESFPNRLAQQHSDTAFLLADFAWASSPYGMFSHTSELSLQGCLTLGISNFPGFMIIFPIGIPFFILSGHPNFSQPPHGMLKDLHLVEGFPSQPILSLLSITMIPNKAILNTPFNMISSWYPHFFHHFPQVNASFQWPETLEAPNSQVPLGTHSKVYRRCLNGCWQRRACLRFMSGGDLKRSEEFRIGQFEE